MSIGKRNISIIGSLLFAIFSWYWCSVTLFSHEHFVDGERIMHSHPFAGTSHNHSAAQMQVISYMAMFVALALYQSFALCKFDGFSSEIAIDLTEKLVVAENSICTLRAPPVSLL